VLLELTVRLRSQTTWPSMGSAGELLPPMLTLRPLPPWLTGWSGSGPPLGEVGRDVVVSEVVAEHQLAA
jgi:hypothetical protein